MSTIPGRYGLRKWNRDAAQLYPGDAWRYGELAGVRTGAGTGPRGVSPIGGQRPPYWSFLKGENPKRGKIEIPLFGPSFPPLSLGRKRCLRRMASSIPVRPQADNLGSYNRSSLRPSR